MRNSSRSRNDMWQPEQPPNQTRGYSESDPLFFLPGGDDEFEFGAVALHFGDGGAL